MKKYILLIVICLMFCGCKLFSRPNEKIVYLEGKHNIEIKVKDYGVIKATLDADEAPITVTNFIKLVNEGFYDNLTFHRVVSGFMIQGGDPKGNGTGGSANTIKGEFLANGIENDLLHERGVISMARSGNDYNSASSQFFIMHADNESLNNYYAAFGKVTSGMEVVDKICKNAVPIDKDGLVANEKQPVIEYIKVVE